MNIAHIEEHSFIYGPGCRFVIWTQGCSIRCEGCWNNDMWDFKPNIVESPMRIFEMICAEKNFIEGVTILGGEPLDQYAETAELLMLCQNAALTTMLFTGYEMNEIKDAGMGSILNLCDILITGRYDASRRTTKRQWIGSDNQDIHILTEHYRHYKIADANYVEVNIDENGSMTMFGFPTESCAILYGNL